jgi:hypothetical protein
VLRESAREAPHEQREIRVAHQEAQRGCAPARQVREVGPVVEAEGHEAQADAAAVAQTTHIGASAAISGSTAICAEPA